jgi:hypothetical protein
MAEAPVRSAPEAPALSGILVLLLGRDGGRPSGVVIGGYHLSATLVWMRKREYL